MNKHFYNPDHIEAFLEGKLSQSERVQFQNELEKDPLLKNEVTLQEDIIEALKNTRKLQLKNRLNNIQVPATPSYTGAKIAASIVLSGLIGWGIHSYMTNEAPATTITETGASNQTVLAEKNIKDQEEPVIFKTPESPVEETNKTTKPVITEKKSNITSAPVSAPKKDPKIADADVTVSERLVRPDMIEQFENEPFRKEENISIPEGKVAQITENRSGIDVTVDKNSDKKFHYKYHENKLFLYGNFDSKTYEILELNSYSGKQVYLLVEGNYYLLKSNQLDPAPLTKITDQKLIEDLNKFNK